MVKCKTVRSPAIVVFCAGSIARLEAGKHSDLDFFVIADREPALERHLFELTLFGELIAANAALGFPEISNDGEYLKLHFIDDLIAKAGMARDDSDNLFTARMLLLLESQPIINNDAYGRHIQDVLTLYFRDKQSKRSFRPLFLLNDLLRYWRTLCLNYEARRHDPTKHWRKKNINLKFSRKLTVFATILPMIARPLDSVEELCALCKQAPLQRLAAGLDELKDSSLHEDWGKVLDIYERFLQWKEDADTDKYLADGEHKNEVEANAATFSAFLYRALMNEKIPSEYRRYLVI
jgi:hypothetical protein